MSEAKVPKGSLPSGYSFVPKGNVFITSNCRKMTQASGRPVYVVIDAKNHQIGLGVPTQVYVGVQLKEMDTRAERAANVLKRDEGIAKGFQKEILSIFPQIPSKALHNVLKIALEKGKGKVGRTGKLDAQRKARLAVWAHVRHCETDYDALLRNGVPREDARQQVEAKIKEVYKAWGAGSQSTHGQARKMSKSPAKPSREVSQATKKESRASQEQPKTSKVASAKPTSPRATKTAGKFTNKRNAAVRNARRAQRQDTSQSRIETFCEKPSEQQKVAPKTSSHEVVATAASFRERRTPKPRAVQPIAPSPLKTKARLANPYMLRMDHGNRTQILRLVSRIDRIERALRIGRKKQRQRYVTRLRTIASLNNQINGILVDADIPMIESSAAARKELVRRLRRTVHAAEEEPS